MTLIFGSVCSGIEAASVAWEPLGWRPAFFAEIGKFPRAVLAHRFPDVPLHGDFTTIEAGQYEPIDLLVGGTPCQSFSVAGKRLGLDDPRGNLAIEYLRLARRLRPRWLVWENVPGVLSAGGGRDFGAFLGLLGECGYGWAYRVLDAQYFGVPQRRRRVFAVGHLGDWRAAAAVLLEPESLRGDPPPRREAGERTSGTIGASLARGSADDAERDHLIAETVRSHPRPGSNSLGSMVAFGGNNTEGGIEVAAAVNAHGGTGRGDFESETFIATALRGDGFDASEDGTGRGTPLVAVPIMESGKRTGRSSVDRKAGDGIGFTGDPMFTLGADSRHAVAFDARQSDVVQYGDKSGPIDTDGHSTAIAFSAKDHGADAGETAPTLRAGGHDKSHANAGVMPAVHIASVVRRLTPRECERLQGLPDDWTRIPTRVLKRKPTTIHFARYPDLYESNADGTWTRHCADGPRYKAGGNSMAVPCMRWIGGRIDAFVRARG